MNNNKGALIFAQSGGPTAVINASACGVIQTALQQSNISKVYCAKFGIEGVLSEDFIDMSKVQSSEIELLRYTPASAFGSCRHKLPSLDGDKTEYNKLLEVFRKYNVRYFIYNGGNDSMDTCNKVAKFLQANDYACAVIGVPKTIDNDLTATDHCPGYGSAAKYIATTCHEIALDTAVYKKGRVTIVEIMGRDAGWLTASSAIATVHGAGPDLIYLPERPFDIEQFCDDCIAVLKRKGHCLVAVSEGIRDKNNSYIATATNQSADGFQHTQLGGVASYLAQYITTKYNTKARAIELSLPQRCAGHITSKTDTDEAYNAGVKAVQCAVSGQSNCMVLLQRTSNAPYTVALDTANLDNIANAVKALPDEYINAHGNNVTPKFIEYVLPLIQGENSIRFENGLPRYSKISPDSKV